MKARSLDPAERGIMVALLTPDFPGRDDLLQQMSTAAVISVDAEGSLKFRVADGNVASVRRRILVEATARDADGVAVHLLLHVVDGLLDELEVYREDSGPLLAPIDAGALEVLTF